MDYKGTFYKASLGRLSGVNLNRGICGGCWQNTRALEHRKPRGVGTGGDGHMPTVQLSYLD
jgi:hypothetical protein